MYSHSSSSLNPDAEAQRKLMTTCHKEADLLSSKKMVLSSTMLILTIHNNYVDCAFIIDFLTLDDRFSVVDKVPQLIVNVSGGSDFQLITSKYP